MFAEQSESSVWITFAEESSSDNLALAESNKEGLDLKEVVYEAFGPGGSALIITAVTDNSNRTTNEVKHILSLQDGKLGVEGSAMWAFDKSGEEYKAKFPMQLSPQDMQKFENLLEALSGQDDVENVFANIEIS